MVQSDKPAVRTTNNGTTDKPATTESTETTSTADRKDNASVNASNQNAE